MLILTVICSFLLDIVLGEPKRYHPLVGFGLIAIRIESYLNRPKWSQISRFFFGVLSWMLLVLLPVLLFTLLLAFFISESTPLWVVIFFDSVVLYFAIGYKSLRQHTMAVLKPLVQGDLSSARYKVSMMVSRDAQSLDDDGVRKATLESVLENGSDAIFAPVFWFLIGGLPAVLVYRFANTLDAMWGYKTEQFLYFGRFSARMDDILNWLPARLVGFSYALVGKIQAALRCWREQSHLLESPNGGVVMTAGAGALNVTLGGNSYYKGELKEKPLFGCGETPENNDLLRCLNLIDKTLLLWLLCLITVQVIQYSYA
ncbi:MAG: adenosylcobinamide-phosphate synthase CbiB [Cellvibrionaceae bacterium]